MNIDVVFTAQTCSKERVKGKNAVVIDVLRFTSVVAAAMANGAKGIVPFLSVEGAEQYRKDSTEEILLGGERACNKIPGFDFGNSPLEYTPEAVEGKLIGITTTNGTVAIGNAAEATALYALSLLNLQAVVDRLLDGGEDVVIVCSGTLARFALEDGLCAGAAIARLMADTTCELSDSAYLLSTFYEQNKGTLKAVLSRSVHARRLLRLGYTEDLDYCCTVDKFDVVPVLSKGMLMRL